MRFQLAVQFKAEIMSFDDLIELEDSLSESIKPLSVVDGHDYGSGEGNIFIITENPEDVLKLVLKVVPPEYRTEVKAAYRPVSGGNYIPIWPAGLASFKVA